MARTLKSHWGWLQLHGNVIDPSFVYGEVYRSAKVERRCRGIYRQAWAQQGNLLFLCLKPGARQSETWNEW